ncbi:unnamed protein product [Dimorphilus gyrociliatus]|uniref:Uncharacterized protein n=1 Tax=Dimorphilus gyrociliatus TaxID=2664684 RepID=A0A7I8WE70_9ANNE|nr:unnamed protein product [Dimorphilus gyrociliatus]
MNFYRNFFNLIFCIKVSSFSPIQDYISCQEALTKTEQDGSYSIKPRLNGQTANVVCNRINSTHGIAMLSNSREIEKVLSKTYETKFHIDRITYGNFNDDDIKEFKKGMLSCSQRISYKNRGASLIWQKLLFYDGTFFSSLNDGQDGICKCFVRTVCDNNGDPQSICTMTGVNGGSEQTEEGEFSVKEDSLPLIEIHTADVGNTNEAVRYTLEKFKCTFQFMTFNLFTTKNTTCLKSDQLTALNDKNIATCISIPIENTIQLDSNTEFEFGEILTKLTFSCKSYIEIFIQKETDKKLICSIFANCKFECPATQSIHFRMFKSMEICDILLY